MKSERGVTLISLTVYIITMLIVIAILSVISKYFYSNINNVNSNIEPLTEYTEFNSYFTGEVNHKNIEVLEYSTNYIVFSNSVQYTFVPENKAIYQNNVKICKGVENCEFSYTVENDKKIVTVKLNFGQEDKIAKYVLK